MWINFTEFYHPPCRTKRVYSYSVSGFACPVMTCISGMLPTAGYSLAKSMSHLVLIVMTLLTPFESCLWISGLPRTLLCSLSDKEAVAQSEVDAFMENCAKRWQTREGTYQLKRRRLKPDVRDSPEYPGADIDMADI